MKEEEMDFEKEILNLKGEKKVKRQIISVIIQEIPTRTVRHRSRSLEEQSSRKVRDVF